MKKIYLFPLLFLLFVLNSCNDDSNDFSSVTAPQQNFEHLNTSGSKDGITYAFKDVAVNPNIVSLNNETAKLMSSKAELEQGVYKLEIISPEVLEDIISENVLFLNTGDNTYLRKIATVERVDNLLTITTKDAYLGDMFSDGTLELSIPLEQDSNPVGLSTYNNGLENSFSSIFEYTKEYKSDLLTFIPNIKLSSSLNVKMGFGNSPLPNEFVVSYEIAPNLNPSITFTGAVNKEFHFDLIKLVPTQIIGKLKSIKKQIEIPVGALGNLPVTISIGSINLPGNIAADISKNSHLEYNLNGKLVIGYAFYNNVPGKQSHIIYENTITSNGILNYDLEGEISTELGLSIIPDISFINSSLLKISGGFYAGIKTMTSGSLSTSHKPLIGSKGFFSSSAFMQIQSLNLPPLKQDILKHEKELWSIGKFNNKFTISNLRFPKPSLLICGIGAYNYDMTIDYQYPIMGKKIKGNLTLTYDVYDDRGNAIALNVTKTFTPNQLTERSFKFNLCIPFKGDMWAWSTGFLRPTSYITNITVTDAFGNTGKGIVNPTTGQVEETIAIGSPFNKYF